MCILDLRFIFLTISLRQIINRTKNAVNFQVESKMFTFKYIRKINTSL